MKQFFKIFFLLNLLNLFSSAIFASNYGFLNNTPVSYFTKEDITLFNVAQKKALNSKDGTRVSWENPKSGSYGYFIPSRTTTRNGVTCRYLKIDNTANQMHGQSSYQFCKINNIWKIVQ